MVELWIGYTTKIKQYFWLNNIINEKKLHQQHYAIIHTTTGKIIEQHTMQQKHTAVEIILRTIIHLIVSCVWQNQNMAEHRKKRVSI